MKGCAFEHAQLVVKLNVLNVFSHLLPSMSSSICIQNADTRVIGAYILCF